MLESVAGVRGLRAGTLDFVSLSTLAADPLGRLVGRFRKAHPGIVVRIAAPDDVGAVDAMVLDGRCELGLTELPPRRDELVSVPLERQEIVAVCPPRTRLPAPGRLPVAKLRDMPLVTTPRGLSTRDLLDRALATAGVEPLIAVETSQREAIAPLVLAGAGTSFLPAGLAESLGRAGRGRCPAGSDADAHDRPGAPSGAAHAGRPGVRGARPAPAEPAEPGVRAGATRRTRDWVSSAA